MPTTKEQRYKLTYHARGEEVCRENVLSQLRAYYDVLEVIGERTIHILPSHGTPISEYFVVVDTVKWRALTFEGEGAARAAREVAEHWACNPEAVDKYFENKEKALCQPPS